MKKTPAPPIKLPETGKKAPAFKGKDQHGKLIQLKDFKGMKVLLFFYPKDLTPTCTTEVCNLRDHYIKLTRSGFVVIGVSADDQASHQKFAERNKLPYSLISDTDLKIIHQYGVWGEKQLYGRKYMGIHRTTFLIDESGKIMHIIPKVKSADHAAQILDFLSQK